MTKKEIMEAREYPVIKSNAIIQRARFQLSALEQNIIIYLCSKILPKAEYFVEYKFKITDFCAVCGIQSDSGENYSHVKDAIKSLADKSMWLKSDDGMSETLVRWILKARIDRRSGTIILKFDEDMKPYLLMLSKFFTKYDAHYFFALESQYAKRIYEILKSYENMGGFGFDLDDLKRMINAEHYNRFPDFRRKVLDVAQRQINMYTDIVFEYGITKKLGRKVIKIRFDIFPKKKLQERIETFRKIEEKLDGGKNKKSKT